jgi:hypothetical protein
MMVNGDDLRIVMMATTQWVDESGLPEFVQQLFQTFKDSYQEFGFNLKTEESYTSQSLFGFGKIYLVDRAWQTATLKKGCKIHGTTNLMGDLPLEYIKAVYSEAISTMSYSVNN